MVASLRTSKKETRQNKAQQSAEHIDLQQKSQSAVSRATERLHDESSGTVGPSGDNSPRASSLSGALKGADSGTQGALRAAAGPSAERSGALGGESSAIPSGPLSGAVRTRMESGFGADLSGVKVQTHSSEATQRNVAGFARGNEVHLSPSRSSGTGAVTTLTHEVAHVVQQKSNLGSGWGKAAYGRAEADASRAASTVLSGGKANVTSGAPKGVVQGDPTGTGTPDVDDEDPNKPTPDDDKTKKPKNSPKAPTNNQPKPVGDPAAVDVDPKKPGADDPPDAVPDRSGGPDAPAADASDRPKTVDPADGSRAVDPATDPKNASPDPAVDPAHDPATAPDKPADAAAKPDTTTNGAPLTGTGPVAPGAKGPIGATQGDPKAKGAPVAGDKADPKAVAGDPNAAGPPGAPAPDELQNAQKKLVNMEQVNSLADQKMNTFADTNADSGRADRISQSGTAVEVLGQQTDAFHGKIQKPEPASWTDAIFPSGKDISAAKTKWDADPFKGSADGLGKVLSVLHKVGVVIGTVNGVLGKVSLIATGLGLILTLLIPPVGALLLSAARVANVISVILSGVQFVLGLVKAGLTAVRIAKEKDPLKRQLMANSMREDLTSAVGAGIDLILSKMGGKAKGAKAGPQSAYKKALTRAQTQGAKDIAGKTGVKKVLGQATLAVTSRGRAIGAAAKQGFHSAKSTLSNGWQSAAKVFQKQTWVKLGRTTMHQFGRIKNVSIAKLKDGWQGLKTHLGTKQAALATLKAAPGAIGRGLKTAAVAPIKGAKSAFVKAADFGSAGKFTKEGLAPGKKLVSEFKDSEFAKGWKSVMGPALKDMPWYKVPTTVIANLPKATMEAFKAGWAQFKTHKFFTLYSEARKSGSSRTKAYLSAMFNTNVDWAALKKAYSEGSQVGTEAGWYKKNIGSKFAGFKSALEEFRTNSPLTHAIHESMKGEKATAEKPATPLWGNALPKPGDPTPTDPLLSRVANTTVAGVSTIQGIANSESTMGGMYHAAKGGLSIKGAVGGQDVSFDGAYFKDKGELRTTAPGVIPGQIRKTQDAAASYRAGTYVDGMGLVSTSGYKAQATLDRASNHKKSLDTILANIASQSPAAPAGGSDALTSMFSSMNQRISARLQPPTSVAAVGATAAPTAVAPPALEPPTSAPTNPGQLEQIAEQRATLKAMLPKIDADIRAAEENKKQALVAWTKATVGKQKADEMKAFFAKHKQATDKDVTDYMTGKSEIAKMSTATTEKNREINGGVQQAQAKQNEGQAITVKADDGAKKKEEEKRAQDEYNAWKKEYDNAGWAKKKWMKVKKWASSMWDFIKKAANWVWKTLLKPIIDKAKSLVAKFMNYLTGIVMKLMLQAAGLDEQEANNLAFGQEVNQKDQANAQAGQQLAANGQLSVEIGADATKAEKEAGEEVNRQTANINEGTLLKQQVKTQDDALAAEESAAKGELDGWKGQYRPYFQQEAERELNPDAGAVADAANAVDPNVANGLPPVPKVEAADVADLVAGAETVKTSSLQAQTEITNAGQGAMAEVERSAGKDLETDLNVAKEWASQQAKQMKAADPDRKVDEGALASERITQLKQTAQNRIQTAKDNVKSVVADHTAGEGTRRGKMSTTQGTARTYLAKEIDGAVAAAIERMQQEIIAESSGVSGDHTSATKGIADAVSAAYK
ncbi:MAG: DUF4157 domain-containing protein [Myxococcales bacterium]|nr:DUF4157 domain-containing protein [Myxococcales bacterium]